MTEHYVRLISGLGVAFAAKTLAAFGEAVHLVSFDMKNPPRGGFFVGVARTGTDRPSKS